MKLDEVEPTMLAGEMGPVRQIELRHQIKVGDFFGAPGFVPVSQAHVMLDTESLGEAGVAWLEMLARIPPRNGEFACRRSPGNRIAIPSSCSTRPTRSWPRARHSRICRCWPDSTAISLQSLPPARGSS